MRKRIILARIIVWVIILSMVAAIAIQIVSAQQAIPSTPPQNITVSDIGYEDSGRQNWFVEFVWGMPHYPAEAVGEKSQVFYFNKVERGTGRVVEDIHQFTLDHNTVSFNPTRYGIELEHGTIYEFYGRSIYTYGEFDEYTFTSGKSNRVKFLTGLELNAEQIPGTNDIKIVWDDVWDTDGRIDYRILISDTSGFTQPPLIPDIIGRDIGTENSKVTVSGGRLEYIYTDALPGREYSITIIPLVNSDVAVTPEKDLPVVRVKTEILLRAKYLGESIDKDEVKWLRWMLFWDPIVKGPIGSTIFTRVVYKLYRYDALGNETFFAVIEDNDRIEIKIKSEDVEKYKYKIEADAYRADGSYVPFYSTTQLSLKTQIPEYPASPEFVDAFQNAHPTPLVFEDMLTDSSATLLWLAPITGEGIIDTEVYYDLYLCDNVNDVDLENPPPLTKKIGSNLRMGANNEVRDMNTQKVIGYRYEVNWLEPNTVYYVVMIAKKNFLTESEDGDFMQSIPYLSKPSVRTIITKPDTESDKPLAPPSPPFRLRYGDAIEHNKILLQLEKSWTEMFNKEFGKWMYVIREDDAEAKIPEGYYNRNNSYTHDEYIENINLPDSSPEKKPVRKVNYEPGWQVMVHVVEYDRALNNVSRLAGRNYIAYNDLKENYVLSLQEQYPPVTVPDIDEREHSVFYFQADNLKSNTTYLVWTTIYNPKGDIESDPSDPIIVTTLPDYPPVVEYPTVPTDLKGIAADTYVDLFWTARPNYRYNIRYGTVDSVENAQNTVSISYEQLRLQPYIRIEPLEADTVYYFWIQAISPTETGGVLSEWSNSLIVKTERYNPPPRPRGFGIKRASDAITENSIFYEWIRDESVSYILEISEKADFSDSTEYSVNGSEFNVTGLRSNVRYYARLFSYSNQTNLRSEPSPVVSVVTRKGRSEYDADVPIKDIPIGEMVEIDGVAVDGVWTSKITGMNAHRFAEKIRMPESQTYSIDLTNPPPNTKVIRIELDDVVIETLSGVLESLVIRTPDLDVTILPGSFLQETYSNIKHGLKKVQVRLDIRTPVYELKLEKKRQAIKPISEIYVAVGQDESFYPIGNFALPLRLSIPIDNEEMKKAYVRFYDFNVGNWSDIDYNYESEEQKVSVFPKKSGAVAITEINKVQSISDNRINSATRSLMTKYEMPSLLGKNLDYSKELTINEGMKCLFDIIPYEYGNENVYEKAVRAGFLLSQFSKAGTEPLRTDAAIYAAVKVLCSKTRTDVKGYASLQDFENLITDVREPYKDAVAFTMANGIISYENEPEFSSAITLEEFLVILERILVYAGEI